MCVKCGWTTVDPNKAQESAIKMALAQQLTGGILSFVNCVWNVADPNTTGSSVTTVKRKETKTEEVEEKPVDTKSAEDKVKSLVNIDENKQPQLFSDLVKKYKSIKEADPKLSDDLVALRLRNYVKGYNNQIVSLKQQAEQSDAVEYVDGKLAKDAKNRDATLNLNVTKILKENFNDNKIGYDKEKVKTNADLQNHFKSLANQYLDSRDTDSNCELSFLEIYTTNLAQHYFKSGDCENYREAISKAEKYVKENETALLETFENWKNSNTANLTKESTPEELLALNSCIEIKKFSSSGDDVLDVNELAEMLLAKSTYSDGDKPDYEISAADSYAFETDLVNNPDALDSYLENAHKFMNTKF